MDFELMSIINGTLSTVEKQKGHILDTNEKAAEYGLRLSERDAEMLALTNSELIKEQERFEFSGSVTPKLAEAFMGSGYISQENYAQTLAELLEVFYEAKEESEDSLNDEELLEIMAYYFEHVSEGCVELLRTRDMEELCRSIRNGTLPEFY